MTRSRRLRRAGALALAALVLAAAPAAGPRAGAPAAAQVSATPAPAGGQGGGTSLEQAARKAGDTGRAVALSLSGWRWRRRR